MSCTELPEHPDNSPDELKDRITSLEAELARTKRQLERQQEFAELQSEIHRRSLGAYEARLLSIRNTLAFQLGQALVQGYKSWNAFKAMPGNLRSIYREARRRRALPAETGIPEVAEDVFSAALEAFEEGGLAAVQAGLDLNATGDATKAGAYARLSDHLKSHDIIEASNAGRAAYEALPSPACARWLASRLLECGEVAEPISLLDDLPRETELSHTEITRAETARALLRLRRQKPSLEGPGKPQYATEPGSMLYVAASCRPYHVTGYTMRTHELARAIAAGDRKVTVMTRPGYPWDRHDTALVPSSDEEVFDGMDYVHRRHPLKSLPPDLYVHYAADAVASVAKERRVSLIHAASDHVNAMPALVAARRLGLPFQYEMRGIWELSRASRIPRYEETEAFALALDFEGFVASNADRLFVISEQLRDYISDRWNIARDSIALLPNGVGAELLQQPILPPPKDFTIAYAGALVPYEGLDLLIEAIAILARKGIRVKLILMGDGASRAELEDQARQAGLSRQVRLPGKVPPEQAQETLRAASLVCLPRRPDRVCEIIPPLKLTEAMALGVPVLVPDLPVFRSEVRDGETGLFFRTGEASDLARQIEFCVQRPEAMDLMRKAARESVLQSRTWGAVLKETTL